MKKITLKTFSILCILLLASCTKDLKNENENRFKEGSFKINAGKDFGEEIMIRKGDLQISLYDDVIDSMRITWKNNFNYKLERLNPKTDLEKEPIFVKITGVKADSYDFEAKVGHTNYISKGTAYIIEKK